MTDVRLAQRGVHFDIALEDGQIESDHGLETAVLISLFTDRRVSEEELTKGEREKRGWFGDEISDLTGDLIGSKLWLLDRENATQVSRAKAEEYAREALQWLLDDGVAKTITVTARLVNRQWIEIDVEITRPNVKNKFYYRFQLVWEGQLMQVRKVI